MLTDQDIQKLTSVFATKEDLRNLATKEDLQEVREEIGGLRAYTGQGFRELRGEVDDLRSMIQQLAVSVDKLAKAIDDLRIEHSAVLGMFDRHDRWIKQIAEKVGVQLGM